MKTYLMQQTDKFDEAADRYKKYATHIVIWMCFIIGWRVVGEWLELCRFDGNIPTYLLLLSTGNILYEQCIS